MSARSGGRRRPERAIGVLVLSASILAAQATWAQTPPPRRIAVETVVSTDRFVDTATARPTGLSVDAFAAVRLGQRWQIVAQPIVRRLPTGDWIARLYQLAARYESRGSMPVRVDIGQIVSPVGLAAQQYRADLIPTVSAPAAYYLRLPRIEGGAPRVEMIAPGYPIGVQVATSKGRADLRAALVDGSPVRMRRDPFDLTPPMSAQIVAGGGVTPAPGLRVGLSFARGRYLKAREIQAPSLQTDRDATVVGLEWEYSVRYTQLKAEWLRDRLETADRPVAFTSWQVEGAQTLTPRWFVAGRMERVSGAELLRGSMRPSSLGGVDVTLGYRVNPDITVRSGVLGRRAFGTADWDIQAAVSIVWARRWW
jgi:hypothetical protein